MDIINKIESFVADIYFKLPNELKKDYVDICSSVADFLDKNFPNNKEIMKQKDEVLVDLLKVMETDDYVKMADALYYKVKPILEDAIIVIGTNSNN